MIQTIYDKITDFSGAQNMPTVIVGQKVDLTTEQRYVLSLSLPNLYFHAWREANKLGE